jgi:serine/threonine protein kinase
VKSPKFDPETVVADRFCLKRPLSSGAMGTVWLAHHTRLDVPCAVKFIDSGSGTMEELERRFEREAKAAALLRCANVVTILDFGVFEDRAYLAMEYLEGETLEKRLARRGQLSPTETVAILAQVGRALAKAHAAGLVHRDLKPANIFLVADDDREIVKVLDFGIVKMPADENKTTQVGALLGTPNYMSPEQARGLSGVDHRSDLWSLAVLAYECVTGELPFEASGIGELIGKIVLGPIPLPSSVALVPPAFDHWWARAAAREPGDRFGGALEQVKALAAAFELPKSSLLPRKRSAAPEGARDGSRASHARRIGARSKHAWRPRRCRAHASIPGSEIAGPVHRLGDRDRGRARVRRRNHFGARTRHRDRIRRVTATEHGATRRGARTAEWKCRVDRKRRPELERCPRSTARRCEVDTR